MGRTNERWGEGQERQKARAGRAIDYRGEIMRACTAGLATAVARRQQALGTLKSRTDRIQ